ncbi:hypothetical protein ACF09G_04125 [Streptomyces albogriseolus]|nr:MULTISPECIES: galactose-1-phosphate uridylyltransferase [unclassified Streptomyces]
MSELRRDPFTRTWVVIAPGRSERPRQMPAVAPTPPLVRARCPFCPGHEQETPEELWRLAAPDGTWAVRVVRNRYPLLTPRAEATAHRAGVRPGEGLFIRADGVGSHEVVIESPHHDWDLPDGHDAAVANVLRACRARCAALRAKRPGLVLPFRNHGAAAGTSLPHPHSQIMATPIVPLRQRQLFDVARAHYDDTGRCLYTDVRDAELADGARIIAASDHAVALAPFAPRAPYETWLMPRVHHASFADTPDAVLAGTAALLRRLLAALRHLLGDIAYNYLLLSAPNGEEGTDYFLWHLQLLPHLTETAGFELGTGMAVITVPPEQAAADLRNALAQLSAGIRGPGQGATAQKRTEGPGQAAAR